MLRTLMVDAVWARLVVARLDQAGLAADPLLRELGLRRPHLQQPDSRIAHHRSMALIRRAAELLGDPLFGLRLGYEGNPRETGLLGYVALNSASLGDCLGNLRRFMAVHAEAFTLRIQPEGDCFAVHLVWTIPEGSASPRSTEGAAARLLRIVRAATGRRLPNCLVQFRHGPAGDARLAEHLIDARIEWHADRDTLVGESRWLQLPVIGADPQLLALLQQLAKRVLGERRSESDLVARLERLLVMKVQQGRVGAEPVARELGMSTRTLSRCLAALGTNFDEVADGLRSRLARGYLAHREFTPKEVAYLLGFSEPAAFSRAFKRWTGVPPSAWRRRLEEPRPRLHLPLP
jgi:AraC-like DNA-binding protein